MFSYLSRKSSNFLISISFIVCLTAAPDNKVMKKKVLCMKQSDQLGRGFCGVLREDKFSSIQLPVLPLLTVSSRLQIKANDKMESPKGIA